MRVIRFISYGMTAVGITLVAAGFAIGLPPALTVTGMLLLVAGIVKIVIVAIWESMFSTPIPAPQVQERRRPPERKPGQPDARTGGTS